MNRDYLDYDSGENTHHHSGRKINKEKYCKKNKLGHGRYGSHYYEDGKNCKFCGKINPALKRRPGLEPKIEQE